MYIFIDVYMAFCYTNIMVYVTTISLKKLFNNIKIILDKLFYF